MFDAKRSKQKSNWLYFKETFFSEILVIKIVIKLTNRKTLLLKLNYGLLKTKIRFLSGIGSAKSCYILPPVSYSVTHCQENFGTPYQTPAETDKWSVSFWMDSGFWFIEGR